jgi:hypothetical protein
VTQKVITIDGRGGRALAVPNAPAPGELGILDVYAHGWATEPARVDALGTISAGYRRKGEHGHAGYPVVSRDGRMFLKDDEGRALALAEALAGAEQLRVPEDAIEGITAVGRELTIAFPSNNPSDWVQQHYARYSTTRLEAFGDAEQMTVIQIDEIDDKGLPAKWHRDVFPAGTDEYNTAVAGCKVSISIYFALAVWEPEPEMVFDDGVGLYRLRTTSRGTIRNLGAALDTLRPFTAGQIAGVPFILRLVNRSVATPSGVRQSVPVFTFTCKPPRALRSTTFADRIGHALEVGRGLYIAPPAQETGMLLLTEGLLEDAGAVLEPGPEDLALIERGGRCDAEHWERAYFGATTGTPYYDVEGRRELVAAYTRNRNGSLAALLANSTEDDATAWQVYVQIAVDQWKATHPDAPLPMQPAAVIPLPEAPATPAEPTAPMQPMQAAPVPTQTGQPAPRGRRTTPPPAPGADSALANPAQLAELRRRLPPSRQHEINEATLTVEDAKVWIQSLR